MNTVNWSAVRGVRALSLPSFPHRESILLEVPGKEIGLELVLVTLARHRSAQNTTA